MDILITPNLQNMKWTYQCFKEEVHVGMVENNKGVIQKVCHSHIFDPGYLCRHWRSKGLLIWNYEVAIFRDIFVE